MGRRGCIPCRNKASSAKAYMHRNLMKNSNSSESQTQSTNDAASSHEDRVQETTQVQRKLRIYIVFYSTYGHVEDLARKIKKGVDGVEGVEGLLFRVPETLPPEVLAQMQAPPPKDDGIPIISAEQLMEADGLLFGFPSRYGCMAAQMKAFFDSTGALWRDQKLAGIPAGLFVSTGTQGGGQETTAWTAITQLAHHGMVYVPIGYTFGDGMFETDSIRGGSPYGAGAISGDGSRGPSRIEHDLAEHQGRYMASIVKKFARTYVFSSNPK